MSMMKRRRPLARPLVGLALALVVLAQMAPAQAPPSLPPEKIVEVLGQKIHYYEAGQGPNVIFLHGLGETPACGRGVGLWVEDFDVRLRNRLSSISQNPQNLTRLLRLKNPNVATTKVIKLAKVGWLAAYDLKRRTRCPTAYRPCCFVI